MPRLRHALLALGFASVSSCHCASGGGRESSRTALDPLPRRDAADVARLDAKRCRELLDANGARYQTAKLPVRGAVFPIRVQSLAGVRFRIPWSKREHTDPHAIWDCRMAVAMLPLARWLSARDIVEVHYFSSWRRGGKSRSQHRKALALDILGWRASDERAIAKVEVEYPKNAIDACPRRPRPERSHAELYANFVCFAWRHRLVHTLLTPDHDRAHHNHLHLDIKTRTPAEPYVVVASGVLPDPSRG